MVANRLVVAGVVLPVKAWWLLLSIACALAIACGHAASEAADAGPSQACQKAREVRVAAIELEKKGHEALAKASLDQANTTCPEERAASGALEARLLADLGYCALVAAVSADAGAEVKTLCDARGAPSKGTEATMRAKMHEAFVAGGAKDYARAKALYLDAWTELHPNPVALEAAARMAGLAGDAAEARRVRDRALAEAEASEHAVAVVTNRVRASAGAGRLAFGTLTIAEHGKIVARDLATGELRALLDVAADLVSLSPMGTLAMTLTRKNDVDKVEIYDLLTRHQLLEGEPLRLAIASPDDKLVLVRAADGSARVIDVATGGVRAKLDGDVFAKLGIVGFDARGKLVVLAADESTYPSGTFHEWDIEKNAFTGLSATSSRVYAALSRDGRYFVSLGESNDYENMPLVLRDLDTGKTVAQWSGKFGGVDSFDINPDATVLATGSQNSVRLWTVADKKQTFIASRTRRGDNYDSDLGAYAFSDDGKVVVLGREQKTMLWDVATGTETLAVSNQRVKSVLGAVPLGDGGMALLLDDEVHVVPLKGDMRVLCKGFHQRYYPDVGPTNVVLSASGKSFACAMSGGAIHVFDTSTWEERPSIDGPQPGTFKQVLGGYDWNGVRPSVRPLDLVFSPDEVTLTVISDTAVYAYDTHTGKQLSKVALRAPKVALAGRHARFADGHIVVKTSTGSAALFDATGAWVRALELVPSAPIASPDAFSSDGKVYAIAIGTVLHTVDTDTGTDHTTVLPVAAATVALSGDGKTCAIVSGDGTTYRVDVAVKKLETSSPAKRAFFTPKGVVVVTGGGDTLELFVGDEPPSVLEVDPNGLIARGSGSAFELRGQMEAECVVGHVFLSQETCSDRAEPGLVAAWMRKAL